MTQIVTRSWSEVRPARRSSIPEGLWLRCPGCGQMIYRRQMELRAIDERAMLG